jgi:hypothetical protein
VTKDSARQGGSEGTDNGKEFVAGYRKSPIRGKNKTSSRIEQKSVSCRKGAGRTGREEWPLIRQEKCNDIVPEVFLILRVLSIYSLTPVLYQVIEIPLSERMFLSQLNC